MRKITEISQLPEETQKLIAKEVARKALWNKHKSKKATQLTSADIEEWARQKMADELGLEA